MICDCVQVSFERAGFGKLNEIIVHVSTWLISAQ